MFIAAWFFNNPNLQTPHVYKDTMLYSHNGMLLTVRWDEQWTIQHFIVKLIEVNKNNHILPHLYDDLE